MLDRYDHKRQALTEIMRPLEYSFITNDERWFDILDVIEFFKLANDLSHTDLGDDFSTETISDFTQQIATSAVVYFNLQSYEKLAYNLQFRSIISTIQRICDYYQTNGGLLDEREFGYDTLFDMVVDELPILYSDVEFETDPITQRQIKLLLSHEAPKVQLFTAMASCSTATKQIAAPFIDQAIVA